MVQGNDVFNKVGYRLKEVQSLLRSRMDEQLRPLGLTAPQYACLELLAVNPETSSSELARRTFVTRQTMNTLLKALQERGLIARPAVAAHGRALPVSLTNEGSWLLAQASDAVAAIEAHMLDDLSGPEQRQLSQLLTRCSDSLR